MRSVSKQGIDGQTTDSRRRWVFDLLTKDEYLKNLPQSKDIATKTRYDLLLQALSIIQQHGAGVLNDKKSSYFQSFSFNQGKDYSLTKTINADMRAITKVIYQYQYASHNYQEQAQQNGYGIDGVIGVHTWEAIFRDLKAIQQKNQIQPTRTTEKPMSDISTTQAVETKTEQQETKKDSTTELSPEKVKEKQARDKKIRSYIKDEKLANDIISRIDQGEVKCSPYAAKDWNMSTGVLFENMNVMDKELVFTGKIIDVYYSPSMK